MRLAGFGVAAGRPGAYLPAAMPQRLAAALLALSLAPASAAAQPGAGPTRLGDFQAWTAATHQEAGQKVCYAFAAASRAEGVTGREARSVLLVVTHRPGSRDQVAVRSGFPHQRGAEPRLVIGAAEHSLYTNGDTAFVNPGQARAVVTALRGGREAVVRGPGPNGRGTATEAFPLAGFGAAYEAISRECPAPAAPRR